MEMSVPSSFTQPRSAQAEVKLVRLAIRIEPPGFSTLVISRIAARKSGISTSVM